MFLFRAFRWLSQTRLLIGLGLLLVIGGICGGEVPSAQASGITQQITYQAKLLDAFGQPVVDGTYQMKFTIFNAVTGGTAVWTASGTPPVPTAIPVSVSNGLFTIMLGDTSASGGWQNGFSGMDWNMSSLFLSVTVSPDSSEMTPRKRIGAVPQAFNAEQLQGMHASSSLITSGAMFVVHQADATAAGSARTALEIRNQGTSVPNDFSIRALNGAGTALYTLNNSGHATGTAYALSRNGKYRGLIDSNVALTIATTTPVGTFNGVNDFKVHGRYGYVLSNDRTLDVVDLGGMTGMGSVGQLASPYMNRLEVGGNYVYGTDSSVVRIIDVSQPTQPRIVAAWDFSGGATITFLSLQGHNLYVGYDTVLKVLDISNPLQVRVLGTYSSVTKISGGTVQGRYAYLPDETANVVRVVDISNPLNITLVSSNALTAPLTASIEGTRLAVIRKVTPTSYALVLFDATKPTGLVQLGSYEFGRIVNAPPVIRGRYIYASLYNVGASAYEVNVLDTETPSNIVSVQSFTPSGGGGAVDVAGNEFFVPTGSGISVYSLTSVEVTGVKTAVADIGALDVRSEATFNGTGHFLRGLSAVGGISADGLGVTASSTQVAVEIINTVATTTNTAWGAYINNLLVGGSVNATGSVNYRMVLGYNGEGTPTVTHGICIDDLSTAKTCPSASGASASIVAEGSVTGGAYDLAERYQVTGEAEPGDLVSFDPTTPLHTTRSPGIAYDPKLMGIVSTAPGFILGLDGGKEIALAGRVPTKFSPINGSIAAGDPLTSSIHPGIAMKATAPGRVIGYALEATSTTSTVEVFVKPGYDAGVLLANNGREATVNGALVMNPRENAMASMPNVDSWGLTFRGSAWDGAQTQARDYFLSTNIFSATSSQWSIQQASSTLFAIDQNGNTRVQGDFFLGGRLYPSAHGSIQNSKYLFLDDRDPATSYIATNADGWQANDSYDFAERYYSPDALTPGDVVVVSREGRLHVQRSSNTSLIPMGIVSTRPAFVAGAPASSTYPIALAGRVPTKVTASNGPIVIGDLLAPSTVPGVAMKATKAGPVLGQALEAYSEGNVGSIEVFVRVGWWGGPEKEATPVVATESTEAASTGSTKVYQGLARITTKGQKVHVSFPSVGSYPLVQITPYGEIEGGWWTDGYSHQGFDILLKKPQTHEVTFSWRVEGMTMEQSKVPVSDGTIREVDIDTGSLVPRDPVEEPTPATVTESLPQPVVQEVVSPPLEANNLPVLPTPLIEPVAPTTVVGESAPSTESSTAPVETSSEVPVVREESPTASVQAEPVSESTPVTSVEVIATPAETPVESVPAPSP